MPRPRRLAALVIASGLSALSASSAAFAGDAGPDAGSPSVETAHQEAAARFEEAGRAYAAGRFAASLDGYRDAAAEDPGAWFARAARAKAADLEAHAEGGFAPLAMLEAVRRNPGSSGDRATITTLEQEILSFPPGKVRGEAALVVAEAWRQRLGDPRRALRWLTFVVEDPSADRLERSLALAELAGLERSLGELEAADALLERTPELAPGTRLEVRRLLRRAQLRTASLALLALLVGLGLASFLRVARRLGDVRAVQRAVVRPLAIAFSLYLGGAAAILVRLRGDGDARPFLLLGLGVLAIDVIARVGTLATGGARAGWRVIWAVVCVAGVLAAAFLSIERTDAGYLASFGL